MTHSAFYDARIVELRLENFRSFRRARLALEPLTYVVGRNGAGKSNLVDAVELMREAMRDGLATAIRRRDGLAAVRRHGALPDEPLGLAVVIEAKDAADEGPVRLVYGFRVHGRTLQDIDERFVVPSDPDLGFERRGGRYRPPVGGDEDLELGAPLEALVLPQIAMSLITAAYDVATELARVHGYQISAERMAAIQETGAEQDLARHGENAADIVRELSERSKADVRQALSRVTDGIVDVGTAAQAGKTWLTFTRSNGSPHTFSAAHASAGTTRALGVLLALHQDERPSLTFIDEIESGFHPGALNLILGEAEAASASFPVVLATHSTEVLSHPSATAARIRVVEWRDGESRIHRLDERTARRVGPIDTVGDLLRVNGLGIDAAADELEGDLFAP